MQTVAKAAGICAGCDQALLNEMVNGMVLCEESVQHHNLNHLPSCPCM